MNTIYIIGEPGVGKSTLMHHLTESEGGVAVQMRTPIPHIVYEDSLPWLLGQTVAQPGRVRESFSGTDALPMNIQPAAVDFVRRRPYDWLLCEGDRLANDAFFEACTAAGRLILFALSGEGVAAERRLQRGSHQDETWLKGRQSKVRNLMDRWPHVELDAVCSEDWLTRQVIEGVGAYL